MSIVISRFVPRLIVLLLPPHKCFFESWCQFESDCEFSWEDPHHLFSEQNCWSELVQVVAHFLTTLLINFVSKVVGQEIACQISVDLLMCKNIVLFFLDEFVGLNVHSPVFSILSKPFLIGQRDLFSMQSCIISIVLHHFEHEFVSWWYHEWRKLLTHIDRRFVFVGFISSHDSSSFLCRHLMLLIFSKSLLKVPSSSGKHHAASQSRLLEHSLNFVVQHILIMFKLININYNFIVTFYS